MNWADQSSDEDSDDGLHPMRLSAHNLVDIDDEVDDGIDNDLSYDESGSQRPDDLMSKDSNLELEEEKIPYPSEIDFDKVPEDFPRHPPFTAHIRNLAFKISTPEELSSKIEGVVNFRYKGDKRVTVKDARLGMDRKTGQRKGFGYVEFDTEKEVSTNTTRWDEMSWKISSQTVVSEWQWILNALPGFASAKTWIIELR